MKEETYSFGYKGKKHTSPFQCNLCNNDIKKKDLVVIYTKIFTNLDLAGYKENFEYAHIVCHKNRRDGW